MIAATPWLGWAVTALIAAFLAVLAAIVVKELTAFARLSRMDRLHKAMAGARASDSLAEARTATAQLTKLYRHRPEMRWQVERFDERQPDQFDAAALLDLAEGELLTPLDRAARAEVEAAARQVATVTALVPLALADVATALGANIRMIRRIAEIYGGRSGTLGSWRLLRAVMTHLVATGAVAMGDDMLGSVLGGNLLARLSRRFGEGVVNGALTARVGLAAMEVCRPMPFSAAPPPAGHRDHPVGPGGALCQGREARGRRGLNRAEGGTAPRLRLPPEYFWPSERAGRGLIRRPTLAMKSVPRARLRKSTKLGADPALSPGRKYSRRRPPPLWPGCGGPIHWTPARPACMQPHDVPSLCHHHSNYMPGALTSSGRDKAHGLPRRPFTDIATS